MTLLAVFAMGLWLCSIMISVIAGRGDYFDKPSGVIFIEWILLVRKVRSAG